MPSWNNITRLSDGQQKKREAAFEAQMLALVSQDKPTPPPVPVSQPLAPAPRDGIQISVTENGYTSHFENLETVPLPVRHRILNTWLRASTAAPPPMLSRATISEEPPSRPPKSRRFAQMLNLFLPGAGQFYLGKPIVGGLFATGFITCFIVMLGLFLRAYTQYLSLSTSDGILATGTLERLATAFPTGTLMSFLAVALVIYLTSLIHLSRAR